LIGQETASQGDIVGAVAIGEHAVVADAVKAFGEDVDQEAPDEFTSIAQVTRAGYRSLAPHAHTLATYEGFEAHANAVSALRDAVRGKRSP
jgi:histidinol dehydrogenase